jgi:hypothetical protein
MNIVNAQIKKICDSVEKRWPGMECVYTEKRANHTVLEELRERYAGITDTKPLYSYIRMIRGINYDQPVSFNSTIGSFPVRLGYDVNCRMICMAWMYDRYELERNTAYVLLRAAEDFPAAERASIRLISSVLDGYVVAKSELGQISAFRDDITIISVTFEFRSVRIVSECDAPDFCNPADRCVFDDTTKNKV